jgi:hypothetical protein
MHITAGARARHRFLGSSLMPRFVPGVGSQATTTNASEQSPDFKVYSTVSCRRYDRPARGPRQGLRIVFVLAIAFLMVCIPAGREPVADAAASGN